MSLTQILELVDNANFTIQSLSTLNQSLVNCLDAISENLKDIETLKVITNQELQTCIDVLKNGGLLVGKEYDTHVVPYPHPMDFKLAMSNSKNPAYAVYMKIIGAASQSLPTFTSMWLFTESLWLDNYDPILTGGALKGMLAAINLNKDEIALLQDCLNKYNMQITITI